MVRTWTSLPIQRRTGNIAQQLSTMTQPVQRNGQSLDINIEGSGNHQTVESGTPNVSISGSDNSIQTPGSTVRIQMSGNKNKATVGMNSCCLTLCGNDHEVIIIGNSGHLILTGNDILVDIGGDVNSITVNGNDNDIRIGGSCFGEIRLGTFQGGHTRCDTGRNLIKIGGAAPTLRTGYTTFRNEIQCQWIETIEVNGTQNRIKSNFGNLVDHGKLNVVGAEVVEDPPPVVAAPELEDENVNHDNHGTDNEEMVEDNGGGDDKNELEIRSIYSTD